MEGKRDSLPRTTCDSDKTTRAAQQCSTARWTAPYNTHHTSALYIHLYSLHLLYWRTRRHQWAITPSFSLSLLNKEITLLLYWILLAIHCCQCWTIVTFATTNKTILFNPLNLGFFKKYIYIIKKKIKNHYTNNVNMVFLFIQLFTYIIPSFF